jgi:phage regulator Rha-like protein
MMNNIIPSNTVSMTSLEVVDLINRFRIEEGNTTVKRHDVLLRDIDNEVKALKNVGISTFHNFVECSRIKDGRHYRMYKLSKSAIMQILNKESAVVRYKTQQYIEALENRLTAKTLTVALEKKDEEIKRLERLIGLRTKDKFSYGKIIKEHLGIRRVNDDYNAIKYMFFHELNVTKWEDITYSRDNVILLKQICNDYKPKRKLF